jgi:tRNA A37 threonylcarbamoyladenosine dehydratase
MNPISWLQRLNTIEKGVIGIAVIGVVCGGAVGVRSGVEHFRLAQAKAKAEQICSTTDGKQVFALLDEISSEWKDALSLADQSPRMSLPPQIVNLQAIRRKVEKQPWPECSAKAHKYLIDGMDQAIDGFITFLDSDNNKNLVELSFATSEASFALFKVEMNNLKPNEANK